MDLIGKMKIENAYQRRVNVVQSLHLFVPYVQSWHLTQKSCILSTEQEPLWIIAKEIPDKAIEALNRYLDSISENKKDE